MILFFHKVIRDLKKTMKKCRVLRLKKLPRISHLITLPYAGMIAQGFYTVMGFFLSWPLLTPGFPEALSP
jgi:hypothetical protein